MTIVIFLSLLSAYAIISSLIVEAIKKLMGDKKTELSYNLLVMIVALIVGFNGTLIYYILAGMPINLVNIVYAILLSIASGIGSMVGYDKVKQAIEQIIARKKADSK